jgi:hypothetical protein
MSSYSPLNECFAIKKNHRAGYSLTPPGGQFMEKTSGLRRKGGIDRQSRERRYRQAMAGKRNRQVKAVDTVGCSTTHLIAYCVGIGGQGTLQQHSPILSNTFLFFVFSPHEISYTFSNPHAEACLKKPVKRRKYWGPTARGRVPMGNFSGKQLASHASCSPQGLCFPMGSAFGSRARCIRV